MEKIYTKKEITLASKEGWECPEGEEDISTMDIWGYNSTSDIADDDQFIIMEVLSPHNEQHLIEMLVNVEDVDSAKAEIQCRLSTRYTSYGETIADAVGYDYIASHKSNTGDGIYPGSLGAYPDAIERLSEAIAKELPGADWDLISYNAFKCC